MKVKYFCVQNEQYTTGTYVVERGWGNGYLVLLKDHPLWGIHYDVINDSHHLGAHGGWTFSQSYNKMKKQSSKFITDESHLEINDDDWIIGFDTSHYDDRLDNWPKEKVFKHIRELAEYYSKEENFI
jgi:hypothetical protein